MFVVYTTESNLNRICAEKDNSWHKIIRKVKEVVISSTTGDTWETGSEMLQNLHKAGVKIFVDNEFITQIKTTNPENVLEDPCAAFLLDIDKPTADKIQQKYGVICQPQGDDTNILVQKGWSINTADPSKEKSWKFFFSDHKCPLNSVVIIDRYFFSSEVGESLNDSLFNLQEILDNLLPKSSPDDIIQVTLIFDYSTFKHDRDKKDDGSDYTFKSLAERVNKVKRNIREYAYTLELLSINSNCYKYEDTHDRRIIANINITDAAHKLKTYTRDYNILCSQNITFKRLFEEGIEYGDKSTAPAFVQNNILESIINSIKTSKNTMEYACNGQVSAHGTFDIQNRLLQEKQ